MRSSSFAAVVSLALAALSNAKLLTSPDQLAANPKYDYVVVGGGTAGLTVADRLTENSSIHVLVVEAGINNVGQENSEIPWFASIVSPFTSLDWNFTTIPEPAINNRVIPVTRGRLLGGSSSINYQLYMRGSNGLYDRWAQLTGDSGWSSQNIVPYFKRSSRLVPPADNHNTAGQVDPSVHGNGPVEVSVYGYPQEIDGMAIQASSQLGPRFKFNLDPNSGDQVGYSYAQCSVGGGARSSAATSHYTDAQRARTNLDVLINTQVTKLLQTGTVNKVPVIKGIQMSTGPNAKTYNITACTELILSAGAIGSPQLLLLSGIGDSAALGKLGIKSIINNPNVGKNFIDHPLVPMQFSVTSNQTLDNMVRNQSIADMWLNMWRTQRKGLYTDAPLNIVGTHKLPSNFSFGAGGDPSFGATSPNIVLMFQDLFDGFGAAPEPATGHYMSIFAALVTPKARGSLTLATANPFDGPTIDNGFMSTAFDLAAMVQGIRDSVLYTTAQAWKGFVIGPYGALANLTTQADYEGYVRANVATFNHATGTNAMSPKGSSSGVVDPDLLLKGASGIRVVDSSTFPIIPDGTLEAATYILAERAVDLIKAAHP